MTEPWYKIAFSEDLYLIPGSVKRTEEPEAIRASEDVTPALSFEGDNAKNILVLVPAPLAEDDRTLLNNILKAVNYNPGDIALMVWDEEQKEAIDEQLSPVKVLCFGIPEDPWTGGTAYEVIEKHAIKYLLADALPVIGNDQHLKRKLWNSLKQLF